MIEGLIVMMLPVGLILTLAIAIGILDEPDTKWITVIQILILMMEILDYTGVQI